MVKLHSGSFVYHLLYIGDVFMVVESRDGILKDQ